MAIIAFLAHTGVMTLIFSVRQIVVSRNNESRLEVKSPVTNSTDLTADRGSLPRKSLTACQLQSRLSPIGSNPQSSPTSFVFSSHLPPLRLCFLLFYLPAPEHGHLSAPLLPLVFLLAPFSSLSSISFPSCPPCPVKPGSICWRC